MPRRQVEFGAEEKHNPAKLENVDQLLEKFKGKESLLYQSRLAGGLLGSTEASATSMAWKQTADGYLKRVRRVGRWEKPLSVVPCARRASLARGGARTWVA